MPTSRTPTLALDIDLALDPSRWRGASGLAQTQPRPFDEDKPPTHSALAKVLARAPAGPYGLTVKVRDEDRVVGTWAIELHPRDLTGTLICSTQARLQACASTHGDAFSNCAFLIVTRWPSSVLDLNQRGQLYLQLCQGVLARLDSVASQLPEAARMPPYVLFLVDGRPRQERLRGALSLARLQSELLRELEGSPVGRRLDLRVAHGHGTGSSPLPPTPDAATSPDLSEAAQVIFPARARPAEARPVPLLHTAGSLVLESVAEAERRHAPSTDWKTASRRGVES